MREEMAIEWFAQKSLLELVDEGVLQVCVVVKDLRGRRFIDPRICHFFLGIKGRIYVGKEAVSDPRFGQDK